MPIVLLVVAMCFGASETPSVLSVGAFLACSCGALFLLRRMSRKA